MYEPEPWQSEPRDWMEVVYGPGYWVSDDDVQRDIGPEFLMYWLEDSFGELQKSGEQLRFP